MSQKNQKMDPSLTGTSSSDTTSTTSSTTTSGTASNLPRVSRAEYERLDAAGRAKVQLVEEELQVGKESRQAGEVEVSKRVVEEQVTVPVTLQQEEVVITRHAGSGAEVKDATFTGEKISVPVREEFATVTKTAHVAEEIEIEKRTTSQQTTVGGTVRHEELEVDAKPQDRVRIEDDTKPKK